MKNLLFILLIILASCATPKTCCGQINTFPWVYDFENQIGLEQDTTDDGDWLLKQGATASFKTGPQGDHTTGVGTYFYVESSNPNFPGKTFITYTPEFDVSSTPGQVISFWCHM